MKTQIWSPAIVVAAFALFVGTVVFAQGTYCEPQWQVQSAKVPPVEQGGIFFDGDQFVNYGWDGTLETSHDGESWNLHPPIDNRIQELQRVTGLYSGLFANGHYLLVAENQSGWGGLDGYVSTDLNHWEKPRPMSWAVSIAQAGKYFFANGNYSAPYMYLSLDAIHWWGIPRPSYPVLSTVAYDDTRGKYYAVYTNGGDGVIGSSTDGMNWSWKPCSYGSISSFACGPARIIATAYNYPIGWQLITSTDGETWTELNTAPWMGSLVRYGNGKFVLLGNITWPHSWASYSEDGEHWTDLPDLPLSPFVRIWAIVSGAGRWLVRTDDGGLISSVDLINWSILETGPHMNWLQRVIRAGSPSLFVAISSEPGDSGGGIWTSPDGKSWSQAWSSPVGLTGIAWGGGRFVAVGSRCLIATSEDGAHWEVRHDADNYSNALIGVVYGGGRFVAAAQSDGLVFSSPDGITWDLASVNDLQSNELAVSLAYGAERFVLGSRMTSLRTSSDGRIWHTTFEGQGREMHVIYGDQAFLAGSPNDSQHYWISPDGETWESLSPAPGYFEKCWYVNGHYVMSDYNNVSSRSGQGLLKVSDDGRHWTAQSGSFPAYLMDLIGDGTTFWGLGCVSIDAYRYPRRSVFFQGDGCVPTVTGLSPASGPSEGGTEVSITGSALWDVTAVYFGDKPAVSFKVVSDSLATAVTPPHDRVETAVKVDSPQGQSAESILDRFTFQSQVLYFEIIGVGWEGSSSKLFINGYGFQDGCSVRIDGKPVPKVKIKKFAIDGRSAVVTGGKALKAMLPKGRNVLITIDNPDEPTMTAMAVFAR